MNKTIIVAVANAAIALGMIASTIGSNTALAYFTSNHHHGQGHHHHHSHHHFGHHHGHRHRGYGHGHGSNGDGGLPYLWPRLIDL